MIAHLLLYLRLAPIFADHMVLQRDQPLHFWGKGLPGATVWVSFAGERLEATVRKNATWSVFGRRQEADASPQQLVVCSGGDSIVVNDILVGDIWLCLGQSNMEFPMSREMHFKSEPAPFDQPLLRLYNPLYIGKDVYGKRYTDPMLRALRPDSFYTGTWQHCDSNSVPAMSAVGYYFGKTIACREQVPVGLINLAIGGCPAETFINARVLRKGRFAAKTAGDWLTNDALPAWVRTRGQENIAGNAQAISDDQGPNHAYKPGFAYQAGIEPITPLPIRGVIWYQGESNAQELPRVTEYNALLKVLVASYRKAWHRPALPFYWVQLSSIDTAHYASRYWPEFRDDQRRLLAEIPHGGMAVSSDLGFRDDVHPTDKKDVGERLARWALAQDYGVDTLVSGPLPISADYGNDTLSITFNYAPNGLQTADGAPVRGFSLDGLTDTPAIIRGNKIRIAAKEKPALVYYGWKPYTDANLCNGEKLPASTFKLILQKSPASGSAAARVPVFVSGQDGYRSFRIPAIVRAGNGDLLAFCEGRINGAGDFGNIKIVLKRSTDNGISWSPLQVVASNDTLQAGNSAPVLDVTDPAWPQGRLFLFYCTGDRTESQVRRGIGTRKVWYKTSTDNGVTWSEAVNITSEVKRPGWRAYANTPGHAMQFTSGPYKGRIYIAANHSAGDPQPHFTDYIAHGYYTDDHGKTFHLSEDVPFPGGNECMAASLGGGALMLNIRNQEGHPRARVIAISSDGGMHWDTTYADTRLPDPVCQGSILDVGSRPGRPVIAVCNPADTAERENLTLHLSYDAGKTWSRTIPVDPVKQKEFTAYSDLVNLGPHRIGVLYERDDYKTISFIAIKW